MCPFDAEQYDRGPMSKPDLQTLSAQRICIIKPSALGDVVQSLPLLPVLRERFPGSRVSWVINRELAELLEGHPDLDEIISFDRRGSWQEWGQFLRGLRRAKFDLVFDLQGLLRTGIMTLATAAPVRVGLETGREGANLACSHVIPDSGKLVPAQLRYWRVAEALGLGELKVRAQVAVSAADQEWVRRQLSPLVGPILAIHPGARWKTKQWPVEKFAEVAARARRELACSLVIVGSKSEAAATERLCGLVGGRSSHSVLNLAGRTTLKQLAEVLSRADLLLSNDSGPMHLAASLGTPVVSVFTCTSPIRSGPYGTGHGLVATQVPCAASYCKRCPQRGVRHMACLEDVTTEQVWNALAQVVAGCGLAARA